MLYGFLILIGCQLVGEIIVGTTGMTVPGAVVGMVILFTGLILYKGIPESLEKAGDGLLKHIGLLFIPAGAGISMFLGLIAEEWDVILVASVSSTILTLIVCAVFFLIFKKKS